MNKDYYAHIRVNSEKQFEYQSVKEHSENTAKISEKILRDIGIGKVGYITGILHDMGKFKKEFQMYLLDAVNENYGLARIYKLNISIKCI